LNDIRRNKGGLLGLKKHLLSGSLIFVLFFHLFFLPQSVFAFSYTGDQLCDDYYVYYRWGGNITEPHKEAISQSVTDWNNAQNKRRFVQNPSASGVFDSYYSSTDDYYGYSYWETGLDSCTDDWVVKMNKFYDSNNDLNFGRSVAGHEIGHILGLAHTNWTALMNIDRDRYSIYIPQTDDINGVNNLY
jgi:hypothetical protein